MPPHHYANGSSKVTAKTQRTTDTRHGIQEKGRQASTALRKRGDWVTARTNRGPGLASGTEDYSKAYVFASTSVVSSSISEFSQKLTSFLEVESLEARIFSFRSSSGISRALFTASATPSES